MSRVVPEAEKRMRTFDCGYCGAPAGTPCTRGGGASTVAHNSRFEQATAAGLLPITDDGRHRP
jgi:hypothetical protein